MTSRRVILLHISDSHGGHKHGLMNPLVKLDDIDPLGNLYWYTPKMTEIQRFLWYDVFEPALHEVEKLANGDEILTLHTGDQVHGNVHSEETIGTREADQIKIAAANLRPILQLPNVVTVRFAFSTGSHSLGEGSADILVADQLRAEFPNVDIRCVRHGLIEIGGITVDYAHHGPHPGGRDWLEGNQARYYLRDHMYKNIFEGIKPPNLFLRAHYHRPTVETLRKWYKGKFIRSDIVISPPLCGMSYWTAQATRSEWILRSGIMAYEFIDGRMVGDPIPFVHTVDTRTKEVL